MVAGLAPREASDRLNVCQLHFDDLWRKFQTFSGGERLFGLQVTDYPELQRVRKELNLLQKVSRSPAQSTPMEHTLTRPKMQKYVIKQQTFLFFLNQETFKLCLYVCFQTFPKNSWPGMALVHVATRDG